MGLSIVQVPACSVTKLIVSGNLVLDIAMHWRQLCVREYYLHRYNQMTSISPLLTNDGIVNPSYPVACGLSDQQNLIILRRFRAFNIMGL